MQQLQTEYDKLQAIYGAKDLQAVYGAGQNKKPKVAFVFMNPTKRNIATAPSWKGLRAQWLGTKEIWKFFERCGLFDEKLLDEILAKKPNEWDESFCEKVYKEIERKGIWITNLAKCTQDDARPLPDKVFKQYEELLLKELYLVDPQVIILFGNQVSSIVLKEKISVTNTRQKEYTLQVADKKIKTYAVFYPVGNGRFHQDKAVEDIKKILGR